MGDRDCWWGSLSPLTVGRPDAVTMVTAAEAGGFTSIGLTLSVPGGGVDDLCADHRLLRVVPYSTTRTLAATTRLVSEVAAANAGVVLDLLCLHRSGGTVADVASGDPSALHLVQLCDASRTAPRSSVCARRRWPTGVAGRRRPAGP